MKSDQRPLRSTQLKTKPHTGLGQKIKGSILKISSKLKGIENIVKENIARFLNEISDQYQIPTDSIFVKISWKENHLLILIYGKSKLLKTATTYELIDFFIGLHTAKLLGIQDSIGTRVIAFLHDYAKANGIAVDELSIIIYQCESAAKVKSYDQDRFKEEIPLSSLIEYFQK